MGWLILVLALMLKSWCASRRHSRRERTRCEFTGADFDLPDFLILDIRLPLHGNRGYFQIDVAGVAAL